MASHRILRPIVWLTAVALVALATTATGEAAPGGGSSVWTAHDTGTTVNFDQVVFVGETTGWIAGAGGLILKTSDGGSTWQPQVSGVQTALSGVSFVDTLTGWIVGDGGVILHTTDGGATWNQQVSGTTKNLWEVQFVSADAGWAVGIPGGYGPPPPGEYSPILRTTNGGQTWTGGEDAELFVQSGHFFDADTGWVVGNGVFYTDNGGADWMVKTSDLYDDARYWDVFFIDADTGWAIGYLLDPFRGFIIKTEDGGDTWTKQYEGGVELIRVVFSDPDNGWVGGNSGTVLRTEDGGETWVAEMSGGTNSYVRDFHVIDETRVWAVGGLQWLHRSVLLSYAPRPPAVPLEGADRFATAVEVSQRGFPMGADVVVVATGRNWPDALGGAALAGALDGPILLVDTTTIPDDVVAEVARLGVERAIILGGTAAVGEAVEAELMTMLGEGMVERIAGSDRYETANLVADRVITELGDDYEGRAFVATGANFPDALAAAPLAAANGWPLFLAHPIEGLGGETAAAMTDVTHALILGGGAAVSEGVAADLDGLLGAENVTRLWGADRYETAVAVATYGVTHADLGWNGVGIATGENFPDALTGGVLQGRAGSVMLLTRSDTLVAPTHESLSANSAAIDGVTFFGGANAVSDAVRTAVLSAID